MEAHCCFVLFLLSGLRCLGKEMEPVSTNLTVPRRKKDLVTPVVPVFTGTHSVRRGKNN